MGVVRGRTEALLERQRRLDIMTPGLWTPRDPARGSEVRIGRYGPGALAAAGTTNITVPADRVFIIKEIEVSNVLGGASRLRIDIQGAGSKFLEFHNIPSFETVTIPMAYPLLAGEILRGYNIDDTQSALHMTTYVINMPRAYYDLIGAGRGFTQMADGGAGGTEVKTILSVPAGARDFLVTAFYSGAIEAGTGVRRPYFGPGPHKYWALPQGDWVTENTPYHLPANSSLTWANPGSGWCAAVVSGLSGVDF